MTINLSKWKQAIRDLPEEDKEKIKDMSKKGQVGLIMAILCIEIGKEIIELLEKEADSN